jgi:hypothetical protein
VRIKISTAATTAEAMNNSIGIFPFMTGCYSEKSISRYKSRRLFHGTINCGQFLFGGSGTRRPERLYRSRRMNKLFVGFTREVLPQHGLFIHDDIPDVPRARIFDPAVHSFNPLKDMDYKKARSIAEVLYTIAPQGENTLTVRNGKRALLRALMSADRLDRVQGDEEVSGMIQDLLQSPVLQSVFCRPANFRITPHSYILACINRAELGDFDAFVLGLFLIGHFKGQVVVPDFGFYGRDAHVSLIRENRLVAGVNSLGELPVKLRNACLLIDNKAASGATFEDAQTLADYARIPRGTIGHGAFIDEAMA